jgi:hypothetical protein
MVNLIAFETEEELCKLTGLERSKLWNEGFNLDDWSIGFQSDIKLHRTPTEEDIANGYEKDELIDDYNLPAHWLMWQMLGYCGSDVNYVFFNGKHYYTVHH